MKVLTFDSADAAATALAVRVARAVDDCPTLVIGLPAGRTMIPVYAALRRLRQRDGFDSSHVSTFQVDEFIGLLPGHPGSFRRFLEHHLLDDFGVGAGRTHFLDGCVPPGPECVRYERVLAAAGGLDLQLLGIGRNGHIGFNEPDATLAARTLQFDKLLHLLRRGLEHLGQEQITVIGHGHDESAWRRYRSLFGADIHYETDGFEAWTTRIAPGAAVGMTAQQSAR